MLEIDLNEILKQHCPRVFPVVAPAGTPMPYVTFQGLGGQPLWYTEDTVADERFARIQINVWDAELFAASMLLRAIEEAVCKSDKFQCRPEGEGIDATDELGAAMGRHQTFMILGDR